MSNIDITNMSINDRISLMEELWLSFERDNIEYPTPSWHKDILKKREKQDNFIPFEDAKENLKKALCAYRDS